MYEFCPSACVAYTHAVQLIESSPAFLHMCTPLMYINGELVINIMTEVFKRFIYMIEHTTKQSIMSKHQSDYPFCVHVSKSL